MRLIIALMVISWIYLGVTANGIPEERAEIEVFFCPETNCSNEFIKLSNPKTKCAFYDVNLDEVEYIPIKREKGLMHNKFCIINESIVWTGSFNPTWNGNYKNNNNVIVIHSKYLAKNYLDEYEELMKGVFGGGKKTKHSKIYINGNLWENYFCPEDKCKEKVMKVLKEAEESIYFMTFSFTDRDIANLLVKKSREIQVKGVMEKRRINMQYNQFKFLNKSIDVVPDNNDGVMHHKVFIVDKKIVITGSYNPTKSGNEVNDENILIIRDEKVSEEYLREFYSLMPSSENNIRSN